MLMYFLNIYINYTQEYICLNLFYFCTAWILINDYPARDTQDRRCITKLREKHDTIVMTNLARARQVWQINLEFSS